MIRVDRYAGFSVIAQANRLTNLSSSSGTLRPASLIDLFTSMMPHMNDCPHLAYVTTSIKDKIEKREFLESACTYSLLLDVIKIMPTQMMEMLSLKQITMKRSRTVVN